MSESPRCPTCGYVMCEDFDERGSLMIPNGKYVCYLCKKTKIANRQTVTPERKEEIGLTTLTMLFHFSEETKNMSHNDRGSVALTLIKELKKVADEEAKAHAAEN